MENKVMQNKQCKNSKGFYMFVTIYVQLFVTEI